MPRAVQRAVLIMRGCAGQGLQRQGLELVDALAADAEVGGQAVRGALGRREGPQDKDQLPQFLKLIDQITGQPGGQAAVCQYRPGRRP